LEGKGFLERCWGDAGAMLGRCWGDAGIAILKKFDSDGSQLVSADNFRKNYEYFRADLFQLGILGWEGILGVMLERCWGDSRDSGAP